MEQVNETKIEPTPKRFGDSAEDYAIIKPLFLATAELDVDDLKTFVAMGMLTIATMQAQTGTAVLMCDPEGNGNAQLIAVGNALLVQPLLAAAAEAAQTIEKLQPGGVH